MKSWIVTILAVAPALTACHAHSDPFQSTTGVLLLTIGSRGEFQREAESIPIKPRDMKAWRAYSHHRVELFGKPWTDDNDDPVFGHNGCSTRDDLLNDELNHKTRVPHSKCKIRSGDYLEPYTGKHVHYMATPDSHVSQLDGEHINSLHNVYATGGSELSQRERVDIANDPMNLVMADHVENVRKGDKSISEYIPPNPNVTCGYTEHYIAVTVKYGLWWTQADHDAATQYLNSCPTE